VSIPRLATALAFVCLSAPAARAADVTIDGVPVPKAVSHMSIDVDITEFREGGDAGCPHLVAGCTLPRVCVDTFAPVPVLDAQLAGAAAAHFAVGVEDGRQFQQCVLESLDSQKEKARRRYEYCLRCEGVAGP
jgi:hypothetical protein